MFCYQAFITPAVWAVTASLAEVPVWPEILRGWREQPFFMESILVGVFSAVAMIACLSLRRLRDNELRLDHFNRVLRAIRQVNQLIVSESDPGRLIEQACANLTETMGYHKAWIVLFKESEQKVNRTVNRNINQKINQKIKMTAASGFNEGFQEMRQSLEEGRFPLCVQQALQRQRIVVITDPVFQCLGCPLSRGYSKQAGLSSRLSLGDRIYGVLVVSVPAAFARDTREQELLAEVAGDLAFALHKMETEKRLQQSQEVFRLTFDASPDAVNINRLEDGLYIDINQGFTRLTGYTREDVIGKTSLDINIWHDPADRQELIRGLRQNGFYNNLEARFRRKDGSLTTALMSGRVISINNAPHIISITRDISERKRFEEALRLSEEKFRTLYEYAPIPYQSLDEEGRFLDVNPAWSQNLGYQREEVIGHRFDEFLLPDPRNNFEKNLSKFKELGQLKGHHYIMRHKNGQAVVVEFNGRIGYNPDGSFKQTYCVFQDITAREEAEAERERLLAAIEQAGDMIVVTDPEGTIQYVNPAFESTTGYCRQEVLGRNPRLLKSGRQDKSFYQDLWETITNGMIFEGRMVNRRKDGSFYTEEVTISPVFDASDRIINFVAVKHDITEHLRITAQLQQAQKMESVGRLAGGVAHDYNNMLSVILGYTELALDKVDPSEPVYANLSEIFKAARRSSEITRQLLAFARKQTVSPKILDLNQTVEGMLRMLRRLIGEDIELIWLPDSKLWPIKFDPSQVEQILVNLCVNARDAIGGVGKMTIETHPVTFDEDYCARQPGFLPGNFVMLVVSDDGCGMDNQTRENIFEPFFTTKDVNQGTGLGLAMVYGIVKQNNGFISVYSEPRRGTTFKIYLPCQYETEEEQRPSEPRQQIPTSQGEMVLLVEDESSIREMGQLMLEDLGYRVLSAGTPGEAIRLAEKHPREIHLLLTDVVMPEMNGRDLASQLHSFYPGIKTIFMSGYTADVIAHRGVLEEGVNFLQKPFAMRELGLIVREILDAG
ncbi:MAG: PAS domain S-box protein, partial [Desulfosudaceae bacterium]